MKVMSPTEKMRPYLKKTPEQVRAQGRCQSMIFFKLLALTMKKSEYYFQLMHPIAVWHH